MANRIDLRELCRDIVKALTLGRHGSVPVIVLAGATGGEGKSLFFKGLMAAYRVEWVFPSPQAGTFPLLNLPGKKICFLDD